MNPEQAIALGEYVRAGRLAAGLSTHKLAAETGIDQAQISRLEAGTVRSPKADLLGRIADVLDLNPSDLMAMAGYPLPKALPNFRPYMRAKYRDLPLEAIDEVEAFIQKLAKQHSSHGPGPGEDES